MKKLFFLLLCLVSVVLTGCSNDHVTNRVWSGTLSRTTDKKQLSRVCLKLSRDTLHIYSNAIFGNGKEALYCRKKKKNTYSFESSQGETFVMTWSHIDKSSNEEILTIEGPDYYMNLVPAVTPNFTKALLGFYEKKDVPSQAAFYLSGQWTGEIIRIRDGQRLSAACVEFEDETLRVYANAIFGRQNEVLREEGFRNGCFYYANDSCVFRLKPSINGQCLTLTGDDFVMNLTPLSGDWEEACAFYLSYDLPHSADAYLFGSYIGQGQGWIESGNVLGFLLGYGPNLMDMLLEVRITFLEGARMRTTVNVRFVNTDMALLSMFGGAGSNGLTETSISSYQVIDDRLIGMDEDGKTDEYIMLPDGNILLPAHQKGDLGYTDIVLYRQ